MTGNDEIEIIQFSMIKTCDGEAFDAIPRTIIKIDIEEALASLKASGYSEVSAEGSACTVAKGGLEISIFSSGRVQVMSPEPDEASRTASAIYKIIVQDGGGE